MKRNMNISFLDNLEQRTFTDTVGGNAVTSGVTLISLAAGGIAILASSVLSFFISNDDTLNTTNSILLAIGIIIAISNYVSKVFPFLNSSASIGSKIGYSLFVLFFGTLGFLAGCALGALIIYLILCAIFIWLLVKVLIPMMITMFFGESSSRQSGKRSSGFRECSNCQHNMSRDSLYGFCELRGGNVSSGDSCDNWDPC